MAQTNPIRPTNDEACDLAKMLMDQMRYGALAVLNPVTNAPEVTRIAVVPGPDGFPLALVSDLSAHTRALQANSSASLLIGEPGERGDPLTHPRMTLACRTEFIRHDTRQYSALRPYFLTLVPKAKLYVDFTDFSFIRFNVLSAALNGGFGKAFNLTPSDLGLEPIS